MCGLGLEETPLRAVGLSIVVSGNVRDLIGETSQGASSELRRDDWPYGTV